jgi:hypothetical protein
VKVIDTVGGTEGRMLPAEGVEDSSRECASTLVALISMMKMNETKIAQVLRSRIKVRNRAYLFITGRLYGDFSSLLRYTRLRSDDAGLRVPVILKARMERCAIQPLRLAWTPAFPIEPR